MKTELKITAMRLAFVAALIAAAYFLFGCATQKKVRDIELKGMYVNGYSEVLALGWGRLTSIPGDKEALAAHYEEDTAWLQPSIKTHKIDIFMVGTNSSQNATQVIESICKAFAEVAPQVAANAGEKAKSQLGSDSVKGASDAETQPGQVLEIAPTSLQGSTENSETSDPHSAEGTDGSGNP